MVGDVQPQWSPLEKLLVCLHIKKLCKIVLKFIMNPKDNKTNNKIEIFEIMRIVFETNSNHLFVDIILCQWHVL